MEIKFKNKKINVPDVRKCRGFSRGKGLMFSRREKKDALLFEFPRNVKFHLTSLFVFFPEATSRMCLKICSPISSTVMCPSAILPQLISISSSM